LLFKDRTRLTLTVTTATVDEVTSQISCYWQIDYMMKYSSLGTFPLLQNQQQQSNSVKDSLATHFMQLAQGSQQ